MMTDDNSTGLDERADDRNLPAGRVRSHVGRHSVLSRNLLKALVRHGENARTLRRIEKELRSALKPTGAIASSPLRSILVQRLALDPRCAPRGRGCRAERKRLEEFALDSRLCMKARFQLSSFLRNQAI